jgi:hypothetical protein
MYWDQVHQCCAYLGALDEKQNFILFHILIHGFLEFWSECCMIVLLCLSSSWIVKLIVGCAAVTSRHLPEQETRLCRRQGRDAIKFLLRHVFGCLTGEHALMVAVRTTEWSQSASHSQGTTEQLAAVLLPQVLSTCQRWVHGSITSFSNVRASR